MKHISMNHTFSTMCFYRKLLLLALQVTQMLGVATGAKLVPAPTTHLSGMHNLVADGTEIGRPEAVEESKLSWDRILLTARSLSISLPIWNFNERVGVTSACATMAVFLGAIFLSNFPKAKVQEHPEAHSVPTKAKNLDVVRWIAVATCFCNVNYACLLPSIAFNTTQDLIQLGILISTYALGTLVTFPLFRSIPATQAKWALLLHAACTIIGNLAMICALFLDSPCALFFGRFICGLEAGVKYTANLVVMELVGPRDRLDAAMTNRLYTSVGIALGPAVGVFPVMLMQAMMPSKLLPLMPAHWAEAVPLAIMSTYGAAMAVSLAFFPKGIEAPLDDSIAATATDQPHSQKRRHSARVMFASTIATNFTRNFLKIVLEVGTIITLVRSYGFGNTASIILFLQAASLFLGRSLTMNLNHWIQDDALTLKILDRTMFGTCLATFHIGFLPESANVALLVCTCMILYSANCCQSGVLMTAASKVAIKNDVRLSKAALTDYLFLSNVAAYFLGPILTFLAMSMVKSQNLMAIILLAVAGTQCSITTYALSFMEGQREGQDSFEPEIEGQDSFELEIEPEIEPEIESKAPLTKVAIMLYQIGKYDFKGISDLWALPKLADVDVSGLFFYSTGSISEQDLDMMRSYGWKPILTALHAETKFVCADRMTAKKLKWGSSNILQKFDVVISHDCDVSANCASAVPYRLRRLRAENTSAILQHHYRRRGLLEEIDGFLNDKPWRIQTSKENCIKWKTEVEDMIASGKYNFDGEHHVLSNVLVYCPRDPCWQRVGQKIYEKCHLMQRDQFSVPWAVQSERLEHSWIDKQELQECGFLFRSKLRHLETGIFN